MSAKAPSSHIGLNKINSDINSNNNKTNDRTKLDTTARPPPPPPPSISPPILVPQVPEIFMKEEFDLSKLETFEIVVSSSSGYSQNSVGHFDAQRQNSSKPSSSNYEPSKTLLTKVQICELQQCFTDYLDTIEEKLSSSISNRSGDFSQVMSSVDSVMDELSLAIKSVTSLRSKCSALNESLILPNLMKIKLSNRRNNEQIILDKLMEIAHLCKIQPRIQLLLSASDFVGALDLIAKSRVMLHKDFKRVSCLKHLESQLVEVERMAGTMIQREFECRIKESNFDKILATEFNNLSRLVKNFSDGFSDICERNSLNLVSLLQTQTEKFVTKFHDERSRLLELSLDNENWKMVECIPTDLNRMVSMLVDENKSISEYILTDDLQPSNTSAQIKGAHSRASSFELKVSELTFQSSDKIDIRRNLIQAGGTTFVLVNSVINMIRVVMDYCKCAQEIRPLSAALMEKLFIILNNYNSRTFHLVHEAGATKDSKLESITSRNLVLAQRSLKLMILLMPSISQHFSKLLPNEDKRLRHFDEIKFAYEDHAAQVPDRINIVAKGVIDSILSSWRLKPPVPSPQFVEIVGHLTALHNNILDVLPANELRMLFLNINNTFKETLLRHLQRLNVKSEAGPQQYHVSTELALYKTSLAKLSVFKGLDLNYDDIWSKLDKIFDLNDDHSG